MGFFSREFVSDDSATAVVIMKTARAAKKAACREKPVFLLISCKSQEVYYDTHSISQKFPVTEAITQSKHKGGPEISNTFKLAPHRHRYR